MGLFQSWTEWLSLRESNSRKRRVKAALTGEKTPLPGSYAANPNTDPVAMDVAAATGEVRKAPKSLWRRWKESHIARPDYSIDRWIQQAQELGDDVNKMVHGAEEEEKKLDKDKEKKEKAKKAEKPEPKADPKDGEKPEPRDKEAEEKAWTQLRKIHKERLPQFQKEDEPKSSAKPSKTSPKRSSSRSSTSS